MNESINEKWDLLSPMDRKQWLGQVRGKPLLIYFSKWDELTAQEQSLIESFLLRRFPAGFRNDLDSRRSPRGA